MLVTFGLPMLFWFPSDPFFILKNPCFLLLYISSVWHCWFSPFVAMESTRAVHEWEGGGKGHTGDEKLFTDVSAKLLWRVIYCANPRPNVRSQSWSWFRRGLGIRALWVIREYNLATPIAIWLIIHPRTYKIGSSIFASMSRIKFASKTRASFPSIQSVERTNR